MAEQSNTHLPQSANDADESSELFSTTPLSSVSSVVERRPYRTIDGIPNLL